jgi:hypothetical protein
MMLTVGSTKYLMKISSGFNSLIEETANMASSIALLALRNHRQKHESLPCGSYFLLVSGSTF